jgi:predicted ATPase
MELLLDRWQQAKTGSGRVVLLSGEAGVGKSRLAWTLRERLRDETFTAPSFQCSPHHAQTALWPVIDHLERRAGYRRDDSPDTKLTKLETLLAATAGDQPSATPLLAALLGIPTGDRYPALDLSPKEQRARTLRALVRLIEARAAREPTVAVLEDAHWGDPTTLELFDLIVDAAQRLPILLLVTSRPEFAPAWWDQPYVETVALDRLGHEDTVAMVGQVAGGQVLPAEVIERVAARTDGIPLFVEELTKLVLESSLRHEEGSRFVLDGSLAAIEIPETLHDSLLERLDRLAPAKEVAQIGAAIGREFPYRLLAAVAPLAEDRLSEALDELARSELVFANGVPPEASYTFKHALVQDAAYSTLLKSRRRQLHARIAAALESDFPEQAEAQPEAVARHFTEAGLVE